MLCQWASDLQDHSALFSGSHSHRTTLGDATAIQLFRTLVLLAHLTASQPRRLVHSRPLFMISFLLSLPSLPYLVLSFTHFLSFTLLPCFPNSTTDHFSICRSFPTPPPYSTSTLSQINQLPLTQLFINMAIRSWQCMTTCFDPFRSSSSHTLHKTNTTGCLIFMLLDGYLNLATYK